MISCRLDEHGVACPNVAVGSTPTCSHPADNLEGVTELHPGNYIVYDVQQAIIGACVRREVAMFVLTRVVGHYPERGQLLLDAGWTALSNQGADIGFGEIEGHPELRCDAARRACIHTGSMVSLTQELAKVEAAPGHSIDFARVPIGSLLRILPYHVCRCVFALRSPRQSCAISCLAPSVFVVKDGTVLDEWPTAPRR